MAIQIPKFQELMNPLIQALHELGYSGSIKEIDARVIELTKLPEAVVEKPHNLEKTNRSEVEYRLAWARTYLKRYGILDNSSRGVWIIAPGKHHIKNVDPKEVIKFVQELKKKALKFKEIEDTDEESEGRSWKSELHHVLTQMMSPDAFERLTKRILRECGFVQVEVTGQSGDGGIDGKGIMKIGDLLSFHVVFQCKRYQGSVTSGHVRDFRGAMIGRADRGLFITTGSFTRDAVKEASRDGAPPIDLVDGDLLANKLKELGLGIKTKQVEEIEIEENWFLNI